MRSDTPDRPRRPRDAAATRAAILAAARACFTRASYEHVGVRDIAAIAGIDAALVIRYFGSKERLFAEAVTGPLGLGDLLDGDRAGLGERLARYVLHKDASAKGEFDPVLALLRSAPNAHAAALLRAGLDEQFIRPLARWLGGERAVERAALIAAYLIGLAVARSVIRLEPLAATDVEPLVALVAPALQSCVDDPPS